MSTFIKSKFTTTDPAAPKIINDYVFDDFNRADGALGTAPVGGQAWTVSGGATATVASKKLAFGSGSFGADAYLNTGRSDGVVSAKIDALLPAGAVLALGVRLAPSGGITSGFIFMQDQASAGGVWLVKKRTAADGYSAALLTTTKVGAAGDVPSVLLEADKLTFMVNGVSYGTLTDATNLGSTVHGVFSRAGTAPAGAKFAYFAHSAP